MKTRNQVRKNSSNSTASPQSKTTQAGTRARPDCLCMYEAGQMAGEIPLVGRQLPKAISAAVRQGVTVDQFIADAISEKLGRCPSNAPSSSPALDIERCESADATIVGASADSEQTGSLAPNRRRNLDIYDRVALVGDKALAMIQDLQDWYWPAINKEKDLQTSIADGRIGLALHVMDEIRELQRFADAEHTLELRAHQHSEQRRAA